MIVSTTLTGSNTYNTTGIASTATLQIGNGGTTGSFSGNIILNGEWSNGGANNSTAAWRNAKLQAPALNKPSQTFGTSAPLHPVSGNSMPAPNLH